MKPYPSIVDFKKQVPHPLRITCIVFLVRADEVLLAMKKRGFGEGYWNGAGGKIDVGETIEQCAVREAQEEIGVTPTKLEQVALLHFYFLDVPVEDNWNQQVHVFIAREWDGEPSESDEMRPQWFEQSKIPLDAMWSDDKIWLPKVLAGEKLSAEFSFNKAQETIEYKLDGFKEE